MISKETSGDKKNNVLVQPLLLALVTRIGLFKFSKIESFQLS